MDQTTFEVVDRPGTVSSGDDPLIEAIVGTQETKMAIKVELGDRNYINWQNVLRNRLKKMGLKLRAKHDNTTNIVKLWCEPWDKNSRSNGSGTAPQA